MNRCLVFAAGICLVTVACSKGTGAQGPAGPQGIQGAQGSQGVQGVQGPSGDAGVLDYSRVILNGTSPQDAGFNVTGSGLVGTSLGVGVPSANAPLNVAGAPDAGIGTISVSTGSTTVAGSGTAFVASYVGDVITTGSSCVSDGGIQARTIASVTSATALTVDVPFTTTLVGCTFTVALPALLVTSSTNVGIGTPNPRAMLDVNGSGHLGGSVSAGLIYMGCSINTPTQDCFCPPGYYVVSGGGWGDYAGASNLVRESRPSSTTSWRATCVSPAGSDVNCAGLTVVCSRIGP